MLQRRHFTFLCVPVLVAVACSDSSSRDEDSGVDCALVGCAPRNADGTCTAICGCCGSPPSDGGADASSVDGGAADSGSSTAACGTATCDLGLVCVFPCC